jgi:hypothetical protein
MSNKDSAIVELPTFLEDLFYLDFLFWILNDACLLSDGAQDCKVIWTSDDVEIFFIKPEPGSEHRSD